MPDTTDIAKAAVEKLYQKGIDTHYIDENGQNAVRKGKKQSIEEPQSE
jgi:hypothetical protein